MLNLFCQTLPGLLWVINVLKLSTLGEKFTVWPANKEFISSRCSGGQQQLFKDVSVRCCAGTLPGMAGAELCESTSPRLPAASSAPNRKMQGLQSPNRPSLPLYPHAKPFCASLEKGKIWFQSFSQKIIISLTKMPHVREKQLARPRDFIFSEAFSLHGQIWNSCGKAAARASELRDWKCSQSRSIGSAERSFHKANTWHSILNTGDN